MLEGKKGRNTLGRPFESRNFIDTRYSQRKRRQAKSRKKTPRTPRRAVPVARPAVSHPSAIGLLRFRVQSAKCSLGAIPNFELQFESRDDSRVVASLFRIGNRNRHFAPSHDPMIHQFQYSVFYLHVATRSPTRTHVHTNERGSSGQTVASPRLYAVRSFVAVLCCAILRTRHDDDDGSPSRCNKRDTFFFATSSSSSSSASASASASAALAPVPVPATVLSLPNAQLQLLLILLEGVFAAVAVRSSQSSPQT
ncbi:hypothetical protein V9T40_007506 [Parthenolecanium corni]|uniref:Uncharacterized protein n=1 Tax=Parthenolecanium corni TaxID=536013 RepID=A0AAN9TXS5_9HEMI